MQQDDVEIVDTDEASHDAFAAYYADSSKTTDRCPTNPFQQHPPLLSFHTHCCARLTFQPGLTCRREPEYNQHLGLAVEQLKDGVTIEQLWSVL